jgi:hypothetical protein
MIATRASFSALLTRSRAVRHLLYALAIALVERRTSLGAVFLFRSMVSGSQFVRYDALTATITAIATSVRTVRSVKMA